MMRLAAVIPALLLVLACGGGGNPTAPSPAPSSAPVEIVLPTVDEALTWLGPGPGQPLITAPGRNFGPATLRIDPSGDLFMAWTSNDSRPPFPDQRSHVIRIRPDWERVESERSQPAEVTWLPPIPEDSGYSGVIHSMALAVREFGGPVVAYVRQDPQADPFHPAPATAHVWEWTEGQWEALGMTPESSTLAPAAWISNASLNHIMLSACADGSLLAAWRTVDDLGEKGVSVARCLEGEWRALQSPTEALQKWGVRISEPFFTMTVDQLGHPLVALADYTVWGGALHVLRHEDGEWTLLGAADRPANSEVESEGRYPLAGILPLPGGQVGLSWTVVDRGQGTLRERSESNVYVRHWNGEDWSGLDASDEDRGVSDVLHRSYEYDERLDGRHPSLVSRSAGAQPVGLFRAGNGLPMVFWVESAGSHDNEMTWGTFSRRWAGSYWEPIWEGSDEVPGMTATEVPGVPGKEWHVLDGGIDIDDQGRFAMVLWSNTDEGARIAVRVGRIPHWEGLPTTAEETDE